MTMIEEKTTYAYKLKYQEDLSFDKIMSFTRNLINDLPQQLVDDMYEMLDRGVVQIDTEPQMLVYIYSFGKMHKAKLDCAFAHLPEDFLQQPEINIIDYGCGQAIGTMCYVDFLKEEGIIQNIRKVTLIEPSETCLKRAALHTSVFLPEAEINTVNKTFDELLMTDIETDKNIPTLHILSNVLDLKFKLDRFDLVITEHIKGYNQFVCVGPYFNYSNKDERISKFCSLINGKENFSKVYDKYELDADKPWTANIKLFSIGELEENLSTEATEEDIKNGIEDEFGVVYSKDGKRLLKCKEQKSGTYVIKKGTKVICEEAFSFYEDFDPENGFWGEPAFNAILIPSSVYKIGNGAFYNCKHLEYIYNIPNSITCIGEGAFSGCSSLKQINIPDSVTCIGDRAFSGCSSLKQILIPDSVTSIGKDAFSDCSSLKQIYIPDSVTSIEIRTFANCFSLKQINIPDSIICIGNKTPKKSTLDQEKEYYNFYDDEYDGDGVFYKCSSLKQIFIPNSVLYIGNETFYGCSSLKQIYIPDSVTSIGEGAFRGCSSLKQINIPDSVTSIGYRAFSDCHSLQQINIPANSIEKFKKILPRVLWDILKEEDDERNLPF